jgi:hypothetical protein
LPGCFQNHPPYGCPASSHVMKQEGYNIFDFNCRLPILRTKCESNFYKLAITNRQLAIN